MHCQCIAFIWFLIFQSSGTVRHQLTIETRTLLYNPKISTKVYLFTVQTAQERTTNDSLYTKTKTLEINYLKIGNFSPRIFSGVVCVVCVG